MNSTIPIIFRSGWQSPYCVKCQRVVDETRIDTPIEPVLDREGYVMHRHTGEKIVTVRCHGEEWSMSNWRGIIGSRQSF